MFLKNHKENIIIVIFSIYFEISSIISFNAQNFMKIKILFAYLNNLNLLNGQSFFLIKCAPFLLKIGEDLYIDD